MLVTNVAAFADNYIWIIINEHNQSCYCIDPGDAQPVLAYLNKKDLTLSHILLTHHHHDHQGGVADLQAIYPAVQVVGPQDPRIPSVEIIVGDNDEINIQNEHYQILAIPGHTSTHIAYFEVNQCILFCGDTLFSAGCGRVFDGTMAELHESLVHLAQLPDKTRVYCAHEYTRQNLAFALTVEPQNPHIQTKIKSVTQQTCTLPSLLSEEKRINPFLRLDEKEVIDYAAAMGAKTDPLSIFTCLRNQKDVFRD